MPNSFMPPSSTQSDADGLLKTVLRTLRDREMLNPGDRVLVGVSGGPDSMVLLHLLSRLAPRLRVTIGVAHLNHRLRGASADQDAEIVCRAAASMAFACHAGSARVANVKRSLGLSLEEAGRRVRYAFFKKIMRDASYNKLALGHHMDDNAEQVLLALLRGSGPLGLSGIPPIRGNRIIRPLIDARRFQIESYVKTYGITCTRDATNADQRFSRNRIRHHLLPMLTSRYNPRITVHLNRLADMMHTEEAWLDGVVAEHFEQALVGRGPHTITLSLDYLRASHTALARRLIRKALKTLTGNLRRIGFTHIQAVLSLLTKDAGEKEIHLPGGICVSRGGERLVVSANAKGRKRVATQWSDRPAIKETIIDGPFPASASISAMGIELRLSLYRPEELPRWADTGPECAYMDMKRLSLPLTLRQAVPGDRFTPLGSNGSQKLKKYFIDHRIPRKVRARTPVLTDRNRIVWLVGQRIDEAVKVSPTTTRVLGIEFFLLDTR